MNNYENAVALRKKAIQVIQQHGAIGAINWLSNQYQLGASDELKVDMNRTAQSFKDCQKHFSFEYKGHKYEFYLENGHYFSTPDDNPYWGDVRLLFDGELVLKSKYERATDEYSSEYRLLTIDSVFEALKLGNWVNELPAAITSEQQAVSKQQKERKRAENEKEADAIEKNFDLGKFS